MDKVGAGLAELIPEEVMLGRLAQSEQMRAFFLEMWRQNPALAARAGKRIQEILSSVSPQSVVEVERPETRS